ncbi:MAG: GNAT family N-acetyltransferase [Candidatus Moranbacteria bacterium]|nr:GNAT family N-acetyltransferase [Candidatus Moranbacteria bacterium]
MTKSIVIKEDSIEVAVKVNATITEFDKPYDKAYFEGHYKNAVSLILVAYVDNQPAGYMVSYDKNNDGSFYCWMAGVDPLFRRLGLLNSMMQYLNDWAKNHGYNKLTIKTRNNRREMLSYLVKAGFNFAEVQPHPFIKDNRILLEKVVV